MAALITVFIVSMNKVSIRVAALTVSAGTSSVYLAPARDD